MIPILIFILTTIIILVIAFWWLIYYMVYRAFHFKPIPEKHPPKQGTFHFREYKIPTEGQKKIQLYDLNPDSEASLVVIAIHGWANTGEIFLPIAKQLTKFTHFFLVNARNHGKSDEEKLMNILKFETDLRSAIDFIFSNIKGIKQLVVIGHSLGAAASILTAADDERVDGVVAISSFADVRQIMYRGFLQNKVPKWLIKIVLKYIEWKIGRPYDEISPVNAIKRFNRPTLLIHGNRDELVPFQDMEIIQHSGNRNNIEVFVAEGHSHSSLLKESAVAETIKNFLMKYFLKS